MDIDVLPPDSPESRSLDMYLDTEGECRAYYNNAAIKANRYRRIRNLVTAVWMSVGLGLGVNQVTDVTEASVTDLPKTIAIGMTGAFISLTAHEKMQRNNREAEQVATIAVLISEQHNVIPPQWASEAAESPQS